MKTSKLPSGPWEDPTLDLSGPLPADESVLVLFDHYSRYYEIAIIKSTTAVMTLFAGHGLPLTTYTDNGPFFVSEQFTDYMTSIR